MGLSTIDLDSPGYGLGLEREHTFSEFVKNQGILKGFLWRAAGFLVGAVGYMPHVCFEKEDVDESVLKEMLKYPHLLEAVRKWTETADQSQIKYFHDAKKIFERIHHPKQRDTKLYRGFKLNADQQTLGIDKKRLATMNPGDEFEFLPQKGLSFSAYKEVTKVYGNVVVSVDYAREDSRMFHITNEVVVASFMDEDKVTEPPEEYRHFAYFESVFLPDGKPLKFRLEQK